MLRLWFKLFCVVRVGCCGRVFSRVIVFCVCIFSVFFSIRVLVVFWMVLRLLLVVLLMVVLMLVELVMFILGLLVNFVWI